MKLDDQWKTIVTMDQSTSSMKIDVYIHNMMIRPFTLPIRVQIDGASNGVERGD